MMKNDLSELLERAKAATGPDDEMQDAIWLAVIPGAQRTNKMAAWPDERPIWEYFDAERNTYLRSVPALLRSVDAALAFAERVLPRWVVADLCQNSRHAGDPWGCTLVVYFGSTPSKNKSASSGYDFPTASLAIIAAVLTALISQEPDHDHQ